MAFVFVLCLLYATSLNTVSAFATPACPSKCICLGNIVDCSGTQISRLPDDISQFEWIEELKLSHNPGLNLTHSALPALPHLSALELQKLGLLNFPELGNLPSLTRLSLRDNALRQVGDRLKGVPALRQLDLSKNDLTDLPAHLNLPRLTKLNLDRNNISRVLGTGEGLSSLQELRLVKNSLTTQALVSSQLLNHLPALTILNLNNNKLRELPGLLFQNCKSLEVLKLSKNQLSVLGDGVFYGLNKLHTLSADQNNLTVVSKNWLFGLASLKELSLRHNAISNIASEAWKNNAPNLVTLDLSYNKLVSLHPSSLEGLGKLQLLLVAHNRLNSILPATFVPTSRLKQLDLSYNNLRWTVEEPSEAFSGLLELIRLDLSFNGIEAVQYESLAPMTSLNILDLSGNAIRTLHNNPFRHLQATESGNAARVILNTTSLVCDCHLSWVEQWLDSTTLDLSQMHATCSYPTSEAGRAINNLKSETLSCDHTPRPLIQSSPEDRIVLLEADVELQCKALVGSRGGVPVVLWRRNKQIVEPYKLDKNMTVVKPDPDGGVISEVVSTLHLTKVQHHDAGYYQCVVRNDHGVSYSQLALIEVQVKPRFTILPADVHAQVNGRARLECAAEGLPPPEMSLQKGGSEDFPAARERRLLVEPNDTVFFISNVTLLDEGTYTCTARSTAGVVRASANLTVTQAPYFLHPVSDVTSRPGDSAVMHCQGGGRPQPSISWVRDGMTISTDGRHVNADGGQFLIVMDVRPEDAGSYTCQLTNTYGTRRQTIHLGVIDGLLVDGHTTLGLVMMAVVVCVVITSLVWVIIIFHSRRRERRLAAHHHHHPQLRPYAPSSLSSNSPRHQAFDVLPACDPLMGQTEAILSEDSAHAAEIVLVGPDTSSEHSTGKDSGVGDSSQRSNEDLRQVAGGEGNTVPGSSAMDGQHSTASSALLLYADHNNPHLPAMMRGGSSLSVATDSDPRYEESRPRLSTFGGGGSATLRRPSNNRPIPVPVPSVLPRRNITATLPHKHSFRAHQLAKRDPDNLTYLVPATNDSSALMRSPSLQRSALSSSPSGSHYKDPNPYSKPAIKLMASEYTLPGMGEAPAPASHDALSRVSSPQYMSATPPVGALIKPNGTEPIYLSRANRADSPQYMPSLLGTRSDHERHQSDPSQSKRSRPSDYSSPSIIYSQSKGVEINGIRARDSSSASSPPPFPDTPLPLPEVFVAACAPR